MYIWIAFSAYLLYALNGVADKFLLTHAVRQPVTYAFYIGITGMLTWFLAPFGLLVVGVADFFVALFGGACFIIALYFYYDAVQETSISRILPIEGGLVPFFTLLFAYGILGERLDPQQLWAFVFLVSGAVLIAFKKGRGGWRARAFGSAAIAAVLFALSLTLTKYIFDQTNFVSGLIWTRLGFLLASICFLIPAKMRRQIFSAPQQTSGGNKLLYYGTRLSGGAAGLLQNYAISIGSVTIVNALQGSQYAVLLLLTVWLSKYYPKILKERISRLFLTQKILAIILISLGLWLLTK